MEQAYAWWRAFQDRVLAPVASALMLGTTLLAVVEIVRRYILGLSFEWQADAVTFFMLSGVYLYFSISQRRGDHLTATVLLETFDAMGPRARRAADVMRLIAFIISFVFLLLLVWWGIPETRESIRYEARTESLVFPLWPFLAVLVAAFAFMSVSLVFQIYRAVQKLRGVTVLEEPGEKEPVLLD